MASSSIEVLLEGPKGVAKAFVVAYLHGKGFKDSVVDLEAEDFDCETLLERLGEFLRPGHNIGHLLVASTAASATRDAVGEANAEGIETRILEERPIAEARFEYDVLVYFPVLAQRIRDLFVDLPPGVVVEPEEAFEERRIEEEATGGMYAPVHRFEFHGSGVVRGEPFGVVRVWRRCLEEPAIVVRNARVIPAGRSR